MKQFNLKYKSVKELKSQSYKNNFSLKKVNISLKLCDGAVHRPFNVHVSNLTLIEVTHPQ